MLMTERGGREHWKKEEVGCMVALLKTSYIGWETWETVKLRKGQHWQQEWTCLRWSDRLKSWQ